MRKSTAENIFVFFLLIFLGSYGAIPEFAEFVNANSTLFRAVLGILITIFVSWHYLPDKIKKIQEKIFERRVKTILSPISRICLGREKELSQLETDVEHKNILLIRGIPGIGKTTLGLKFRDRLEEKGYKTFWYQCDSESYEGLLLSLEGYLRGCGSVSVGNWMGELLKERLKAAVEELCNYPTVLFLDNFQVLKDDSDFKVFEDYLKNSHLVIMSRIQPTFLSEDYDSLKFLDRDPSVELLELLNLKEPPEVLEKIYEKTRGHPWSLVQCADLARVLPVKKLLGELPAFGRDQENYMNEECWKHLNESEKDFLMRASVFTKPLTFDALRVCTKELLEVLTSLAGRVYIMKGGEHYIAKRGHYIMKGGEDYYIHDITKDFALSKLKETKELYVKAQRRAAYYYWMRVSAENLLQVYHHLMEAGDRREAVDSINECIDYFWEDGFWSDVREVLEESLNFFKDEEMIAAICHSLGVIANRLGERDKAMEYYKKSAEIEKKLWGCLRYG